MEKWYVEELRADIAKVVRRSVELSGRRVTEIHYGQTFDDWCQELALWAVEDSRRRSPELRSPVDGESEEQTNKRRKVNRKNLHRELRSRFREYLREQDAVRGCWYARDNSADFHVDRAESRRSDRLRGIENSRWWDDDSGYEKAVAGVEHLYKREVAIARQGPLKNVSEVQGLLVAAWTDREPVARRMAAVGLRYVHVHAPDGLRAAQLLIRRYRDGESLGASDRKAVSRALAVFADGLSRHTASLGVHQVILAPGRTLADGPGSRRLPPKTAGQPL